MQRSVESKPILLAEFKQTEVINKHSLKSMGVCSGNTDFWLCHHLMFRPRSFNELSYNEKAVMHKLKMNFGDVLLLQKAFNERKSIADLGVISFRFAEKNAIAKKRFAGAINYDARQSLNQKAEKFLLAAKSLLSGNDPLFINFCFYWTDAREEKDYDEVAQGKPVKNPVDGRVQRGHSIGIIANLCQGCEIVVFDSNSGSRAFLKKEDFYQRLLGYFKYTLRHDGVPIRWCSFHAMEVPLEKQTELRAFSVFKPKPDIVIEIKESNVLQSIRIDR